MRFVFVSDLHGAQRKFDAVLRYALENQIGLIHLGADILPKGAGMLKEQKHFCKCFLREFHARCSEHGIKLLMSFGNDDLYTRKKYVREYTTLLDDAPVEYGGYTFKAYSFVPDFPFGLKSACKYDYAGWLPEPYISRPVEATDEGIVPIDDVESYFRAKGTIEDDLRSLRADAKTVVSIHTPPYGLGLDVCRGGRTVGSKSVLSWIESEKPRLVLCGHIHESPDVSGVWQTDVGATEVIQPGQSDEGRTDVFIVDIDLDLATGNSIIERNMLPA